MIIISMQYFGGNGASSGKSGGGAQVVKSEAEKEVLRGNKLFEDALELENEAKELSSKRSAIIVRLARVEDDLGTDDPEAKSLRKQANSLKLEIRDLKSSAKSLRKQSDQAYNNARRIENKS